MAFHGDYEIDFEIYEQREGDWRSHLLGHMVGMNPEEAKARWLEAHETSTDRTNRIHAVPALEEWK